DDVANILDDAEKQIMDVSSDTNSAGFRNIKEVVQKALDEINAATAADTDVTGLSTAFVNLDKMTGGLHEDELIILAARPGVGKTSFAMNVAQYAGLHDHKTVAVFSLEMSGEQLVQRMLASEGLIDSMHLRTGQLNNEE
ncbi:replicative DNA helicase, partial [Veillonellaceae bacterium M2-4]|nr:replicative DNA helicase [Veillonellaceae bacterium M2-4]